MVASFLNSGTRRRPRSYLGGLLANQMIRNREARHATKAALAGLRSGSIRGAGCRYGYDCTARIEHLSLPEPATWGFCSGHPSGPFLTDALNRFFLRAVLNSIPKMAAQTELAESGRFELPFTGASYSSPRRPRRSRCRPMNNPTMNTAPHESDDHVYADEQIG